jgi:Uma2 family endonuclease
MKLDTLAPWGEAILQDRLILDVDELLELPDDSRMYELVAGRLVRMPPGGGGNSARAMTLGAALLQFVGERGLGEITGADGAYLLSGPDELPTAFAPDVAFVRAGRYPPEGSPECDRIWRLAPDLAVEIVSPNQYRPAMARKAPRYLEAGVRLIWMVWPKYKHVDVWRPGSDKPIATLGLGDSLDGLDVLPGFTYPVA